jgi:four helix bundle protein
MRDYSKIEAWKLADDLTVAVYDLTRTFPREEIYGMTSQLRRAACSVPANIVEGSSREGKRDYLHFLYIARGSLSETQYFIHLASRLGYVEREQADRLITQTRQVFACLHGLVGCVEKEAGKLGKVVAAVTSLFVLSVWSRSPWSVVFHPVVPWSVIRGPWSFTPWSRSPWSLGQWASGSFLACLRWGINGDRLCA